MSDQDEGHVHEDGPCEEPDEEIIRETDQAISNALRDALNARFPVHAPHIIVNWQATATIVAKDGHRYTWCVDALDALPAETLGNLTYALHMHQARINRHIMEEY